MRLEELRKASGLTLFSFFSPFDIGKLLFWSSALPYPNPASRYTIMGESLAERLEYDLQVRCVFLIARVQLRCMVRIIKVLFRNNTWSIYTITYMDMYMLVKTLKVKHIHFQFNVRVTTEVGLSTRDLEDELRKKAYAMARVDRADHRNRSRSRLPYC
jgi:hypothetical protein